MSTRVICIVVYTWTIRRSEFSASHMHKIVHFCHVFTYRSIGRAAMTRPGKFDDLLGHLAANRLRHLHVVLIPCNVNQDLTISQIATILHISGDVDGRK